MSAYIPYHDFETICKNIAFEYNDLTGEPYEDLMILLVKISEEIKILRTG